MRGNAKMKKPINRILSFLAWVAVGPIAAVSVVVIFVLSLMLLVAVFAGKALEYLLFIPAASAIGIFGKCYKGFKN